MYARTALVWFGIMVLAIVNGGFRERVLNPRLGDTAGHVASTVILSAAIVLAAFLTIEWIAPSTHAVGFRFPPYGAKM